MHLLTKFSLKNAFVVFLAIILIVTGGIYSGSGIKEESMPNISIPIVTIYTVYPGASPKDVAEGVTRPIQKAIASVNGISDVKGISNENVSIVVAQFDYSADIEKGEKSISDAINKVALPSNSQKPNVAKITMGSFPVMTFSIESTKPVEELSDIITNKIEPELSGVSGVENVDIKGINDSYIYIKLDEAKLKANNLTLQTVENYINAENISYPIGQTEINNSELSIRVSNKLKTIEELKSIPLIIAPDTSKIFGDSLKNLGTAIGTIGKSVGELAGGMAASNKALGTLIANNTQSIALLTVIQQQEGIIMTKQSVLSSMSSTTEEKQAAASAITTANAVIQSASSSLQQLLNAQAEIQKKMSTSSTNSSSTSSSASSSKVNASIKVITLKDVATITSSTEDATYYARSNFKNGMVINIYKSDDANLVQLANSLKSKISQLSTTYSDIKFNTIDDTSVSVTESVQGMMNEGLLGALFAMVVIALFLRNVKSTIIAIVSIPLSVLITLIMLPRLGITLNIMSLGGIAVAVGRIVDDSIVVIENIYRHLSVKSSGEIDKSKLIETATHEVGSAITSSTITTVAVFLPLSFISGLIGRVFIPFAYTVVISIVASLIVALTVVPIMSRAMLTSKNIKHVEKEGILTIAYKRLLTIVLKRKLVVLLICTVVLIASLGLLKKIGVQFMPSSNSNIVNVKLTMPVGTSSDATNSEATRFENYLKTRSDIEFVTSIVGDTSSSSKSVLSNQSSNIGSFIVVFKKDAELESAMSELRNEAGTYNKPGESMTVTPQSVTGTQTDNIEVVVRGNSFDDISTAASKITSALKTLDSISNITNNVSDKRPEISISLNTIKAAQKGVLPATAASLLRSYLSYSEITTLDDANSSTVLIGFDNSSLDTVDKIKNLKIESSDGTLKISDIADVVETTGPASISELNGEQYASVSADIKISDTNKVSKDAIALIENIKSTLPDGVTYEITGSNKNITDGFSQMGMAMAIAVALVYIVMVITFGEGKTPFAILFSLPFAGTGAIAALYIAKQPLTVSGMIGILMLIGIVVTNAIVLLDRVKKNEKDGMDVTSALIEAGSVRLRPILMTAISTVMALIPLALGISHGTLISQGLGIAVIGGLVFSTILTLIIVPVMYSLLNWKSKS